MQEFDVLIVNEIIEKNIIATIKVTTQHKHAKRCHQIII